MPENNPQRPVSPLLKKLQTQEQSGVRNFLRTIGPLIFVAGLICTIVGMISFFLSFGSFASPRFFWLCFVGMPLMFVGGVMSEFGFFGSVARYIAGESAPVAADTVNYMVDETKGAVETIAKSAAKGIVEGIESGRATAENFCPHCGSSVKADFKFCPKCGKTVGVA